MYIVTAIRDRGTFRSMSNTYTSRTLLHRDAELNKLLSSNFVLCYSYPFIVLYPYRNFRSSHQRCSIIKGVLRNFAKFTGKHLCQSFFFNKKHFIKKEILAQVFSCEFCEISKNTFFTEHLRTTASEIYF